jgi:GAF domain-containing protein
MPKRKPEAPARTVADLERELSQARAERDEALAQQAAAAEVLQVINSSPGDLMPVFEAMLEKAVRLCDATYGTMFTQDGDRFRAVALRDVPEKLAEFLERESLPLGPETFVGRVMRDRSPLHIVDITTEEPYRLRVPIAVAGVEFGGARTMLTVPLMKDDTLLGIFQLVRQKVRPFSDRQIALVENFAAQAVIAMENARLLTETKEALAQQTAIAEVLQVINSSPGDLAPVFEAILEKAHHLCAAERGTLFLREGDHFRAVAMRGVPEPLAERLRQGEVGLDAPPVRPLLAGEPFVHITDMSAVIHPLAHAAHAGGVETLLSVPLRKADILIGLIVSGRFEARPFSDKQIALLQNFAAQAVIAMENARLITETREALDQQTATAEVLQVINSSPGDLKPVFDAMLDKALELCEADFGTLQTHEGGFFEPVAATGDASFVKRVLSVGRLPLSRGVTHERIAKGAPVVHLADIREDSVYLAGSADMRAASDAAGLRTLLSVALRKDDQVLGQISVYRKEVRPFSDKQIALLQNFAAQAVIAMENARLITETQEALDQQTATAEVLQVINANPGDLQPVFDVILEKAMALCDVAYGDLELYDGDTFRAVATLGLSDAFAEQLRRGYPAGDNPATRPLVAGERLSHIVNMAEADFSKVFTHAPAKDEGHHTLLCVPLRRENALLGMIACARREVRAFSEKEIALLENFAAQAVIAMENARLLTETREALEQQQAIAEVLQVINSSPGDLTPVFDVILEKAHALCGVDHGSLQLYDGETYRAVAIRGAVLSVAEQLRRARRPDRNHPTHRLFAGELFVHVPDLAEVDTPGAQNMVKLAGLRTVLYVALRKEQTVLGFIGVGRKEVRLFTDKEIALLQNFAAQAVIAIENARLLGELRQRTEEVAGLNRDLEARVAAQLAELERTGKLRRFLAPQLADLIVAQGDESILESHRREIVVVFCDLRGFTAFAERAEPEEVMALLGDYHAALGPIVASFEGTLDHYAGDGIMVFFNDPVPTPDPAKRAIAMAVAMREAAQTLLQAWRRHGHDIGFGVGISQGYATLGQIGFAERMDYTAIGTVTNLAARLCAEAKDGQILVSRRVATAVEDAASLEEIGDLSLKGLSQAVAVYNVAQQASG